ncbi:hypothetical protein DINM_006996 [Dirofilaria immitis]|nr:hypothetical protein [Dirofilaria immitis]
MYKFIIALLLLSNNNNDIRTKPRPQTLWKAFRHKFHWKCLLTTLLVHLCISYAIWCHLNHYVNVVQTVSKYSYGPCSQGYNFIPIAFGIMLYILYIMECWHNRAKITMEYIEKMRSAPPIVWWRSICYHYVRRARQVTRYRNGDAISALQTFYEQVNSHVAGSVFIYDACGVKDVSKSLVDLERYPITRINITKGFIFACIQAANEFEDQRSRFLLKMKFVREGLDFAGMQFIESLIVYSSHSNKRPWYLTSTAFWISSIILLSWPLRIICDLRTAHVNYQISKLFGTNYLSPSSVNYTGMITHESINDSRDFDSIEQRDSYLVVPSYSEAMLMEPSNQHVLPNGHFRNRNRIVTTCNEDVMIMNYGAVRNSPKRFWRNEPRPSSIRRNFREGPFQSRSMSLMFNKVIGRSDPLIVTTPSSALPRALNGSPRSASIAGLSVAWRSPGYNAISEEPMDDRYPLIEPMRPIDEAPPPYEAALKMCAPFYKRLRRSANSLTSRLNSLSHSTSKEFSYRRQVGLEDQGSTDNVIRPQSIALREKLLDHDLIWPTNTTNNNSPKQTNSTLDNAVEIQTDLQAELIPISDPSRNVDYRFTAPPLHQLELMTSLSKNNEGIKHQENEKKLMESESRPFIEFWTEYIQSPKKLEYGSNKAKSIVINQPEVELRTVSRENENQRYEQQVSQINSRKLVKPISSIREAESGNDDSDLIMNLESNYPNIPIPESTIRSNTIQFIKGVSNDNQKQTENLNFNSKNLLCAIGYDFINSQPWNSMSAIAQSEKIWTPGYQIPKVSSSRWFPISASPYGLNYQQNPVTWDTVANQFFTPIIPVNKLFNNSTQVGSSTLYNPWIPNQTTTNSRSWHMLNEIPGRPIYTKYTESFQPVIPLSPAASVSKTNRSFNELNVYNRLPLLPTLTTIKSNYRNTDTEIVDYNNKQQNSPRIHLEKEYPINRELKTSRTMMDLMKNWRYPIPASESLISS